MRRFIFPALFSIVMLFIGACSGEGEAFRETWLPHVDTTRPMLAFFFTDN